MSRDLLVSCQSVGDLGVIMSRLLLRLLFLSSSLLLALLVSLRR